MTETAVSVFTALFVMDKIAEIFQSRSKKASYLTSNGEELLKHLITGGCVNTQEGSRLVCGLWACSH